MESIVIGDLSICPELRRVEVSGKKVRVIGKQWEFLQSLALAGGAVTREFLLALLYPDPQDRPTLRSLDVLAKAVRNKLATASDGKNYITALRGSGYTLQKPDTP
jgi:DNA-binding response OmpR family regulator